MKEPPILMISSDYLEVGMAEGELYEVSSSCSDAVDSSASDDNGNLVKEAILLMILPYLGLFQSCRR